MCAVRYMATTCSEKQKLLTCKIHSSTRVSSPANRKQYETIIIFISLEWRNLFHRNYEKGILLILWKSSKLCNEMYQRFEEWRLMRMKNERNMKNTILAVNTAKHIFIELTIQRRNKRSESYSATNFGRFIKDSICFKQLLIQIA